MRRRLLNLLTALSLLLCVAACVLWARSYGGLEGIGVTNGRDDRCRSTDLELISFRGLLIVEVTMTGNRQDRCEGEVHPSRWGITQERLSPPPKISSLIERIGDRQLAPWNRAGFAAFDIAFRGSVEPYWWWRYRGVLFPHWAAVVSTALLPFQFLVRTNRVRLRSRGGLCPRCGYDLRAAPGRCPECGSIPKV